MKDLASNQRRHLRALAHHLKPIVSIGKAGASPAVLLEVKRCLEDHELIKIRVDVDDRDTRAELAEELAKSTEAILVQTIGLIAVLYKASAEPTIVLPAKKVPGPATKPLKAKGPKADWSAAHAAWSQPVTADVDDADGDEPAADDDELPTAKAGLEGGASV